MSSFDHNLAGIFDGQSVVWDEPNIQLVPAWVPTICNPASGIPDGHLLQFVAASGCFVSLPPPSTFSQSNATQDVPDGTTWTQATYDTLEHDDTDGLLTLHSSAAVLANDDMLLDVSVTGTWAASPAGERDVRLARYDSMGTLIETAGGTRTAPAQSGDTKFTMSWPFRMDSGDRVYTELQQTSGSPLAVNDLKVVAEVKVLRR